MDFTKKKQFQSDSVTEEGIYSYLDCDVIVIDRYTPSRLETDEYCLAQDELPGGGTVIFFEKEYFGCLALKVPSGNALRTEITIDGDEYDFALLSVDEYFGYALVSGPFEAGCRVRLTIYSGSAEAAEEPADSTVKAEETAEVNPVSDTDTNTAPAEEYETEIPAAYTDNGTAPAEEYETAIQTEETDQSPVPEFVFTDNGTVSYNVERSRFFVALEHNAREVTLTLPEGYSFSDSRNITENASGTACAVSEQTFALSESLFTSYEISISALRTAACRSYDLAIMQAPENDNACMVHAYTPIVGAFAGETCYCIDHTCKASEAGTHGTLTDPSLGIDPVTGYKWGRMDASSYYFELENGSYELLLSCTGPGARLIANQGDTCEKLLAEETSTDVQRFLIRVTNGRFTLVLSGSEDVSVQFVIIRAIDTIALESGYVLISSIPVSAFDESRSVSSGRPTKGQSPSGKASSAKSSGKPRAGRSSSGTQRYKPEVQAHINNKLAGKKNAEAVKTVGIVTGAVALAAGIVTLFTKDRK